MCVVVNQLRRKRGQKRSRDRRVSPFPGCRHLTECKKIRFFTPYHGAVMTVVVVAPKPSLQPFGAPVEDAHGICICWDGENVFPSITPHGCLSRWWSLSVSVLVEPDGVIFNHEYRFIVLVRGWYHGLHLIAMCMES